MLSKAIIRLPAISVVNGITTANLGKPDYDLLVRQHDNYADTLESCGVEVLKLPEMEDFPDSVFIEDVAIVTPFFALITNPGADSSKGETEGLSDILAPYFMDVESIEAPGTLDGGDVLQVGDHFFIGISERTNLNGAFQLILILKKQMLTGSTIQINKLLHLKSGISYLGNNNLLLGEELSDHPSFEEFNLIKVDRDEAYAANAILVNNRIILPAGYPKTKSKIEIEGYQTIELDMSEFQKLDGGLSCLSLRY